MASLNDLNTEQRQAVEHVHGPLLIVAGAGTGKTTVLTRRYTHLLQSQKLKADNLLALTFTEKAAGEMEDRVLAQLPNGTYDFWISTFHGFCQRVLEAQALEIGLPNRFRLLTPTDAWLLMRRRFSDLPLDHYRPLGSPYRFLRALLQHISRAKDEGVTAMQYLRFAESTVLEGTAKEIAAERKRLLELAHAYEIYQRILLDEECLDFGDLIVETLRLFRERPTVLRIYQQQFPFIMVDEFQDTNWAQYEMLKLLAGMSTNLTVVGDDDQAIYKFRGASLANILQFRDDFPQAKTITLTKNYRSRREILDCAYTFIQKNNPNRLEIRLADIGLNKQLEAINGDGGSVETIWRSSVESEAKDVVERIIEKQRAGASWNDVAILVRSNDGAEPFIRELERRRVPFQFMALRGLYSKPTVLDICALLSLLDGYHEPTAVWRALVVPGIELGAKDRAQLLQFAQRRGYSLWRVAQMATESKNDGPMCSENGRNLLTRLVKMVANLSEVSKRERPLVILQKLLNESGYLAAILRQPEGDKQQSLAHLHGFAQRIKRYEQAVPDPSLRELLEEINLELEAGEEGALSMDPDAGPEMVRIFTVHGAKGLEFPYIFVPSLVDQRFPARGRPEAIPLSDGLVREILPVGDHHLEEERRLMYVAITRAKESITFSGAGDYGGTRDKKPSPFWTELELAEPIKIKDERDETRLITDEQTAMAMTLEERSLYPLKKRFSFTQLAAFNKCPLQYKFEHIYRIPKLGIWQQSLGQSIHVTFQRILEMHREREPRQQASLFDSMSLSRSGGGLRVTQAEAVELFNDIWIDEWYESRAKHDEAKQRALEAVGHFVRAYSTSVPDILAVEQDFTLRLGSHSVKGKIDRIDRNADGTVTVYDYKTGAAKESLDADGKAQLHLYQVALEAKGLRVSKMAFIYVLDWQILEVEPMSEKERQAFLNKLEKTMDAVLVSDFKPKPDTFTCRSCDFRHICEFRKL